MISITYFKALSDITRIRLFNVLLHFELSVNELVELMGMGQSRISRHLKILTDSGLLECRRDGVWAFYSLNNNDPVLKFSNSIAYLFKAEPVLTEDVNHALKIIDKRKQTTNIFFNSIAFEWDRLKTEILTDFDLNSAILEYIQTGSIVADLGCGTGDLLSHLEQHVSRIIGVDSSSKMLDKAKERFLNNGKHIDLRLGELEHLPIGDREADHVIFSLVLHHLTDPAQAISESRRILQPEGTLIIADFEKHTNEKLRKIYGDRWLGFSKTEVEEWLNNNGFSLNSIQSYDLKKSIKLNIFNSIKK